MKKITLILITLFVTFGLLQMVKAEESEGRAVVFENNNFVCTPGHTFKTSATAVRNGKTLLSVDSLTSSDETVATVEDDPEDQTRCLQCKALKVKCKKAGTVTLTATASDGITTGTAEVTVKTSGTRIQFEQFAKVPGTFHILSNGKGNLSLSLNGIPSSEKDNIKFKVRPLNIISFSKAEILNDNTINVEINYLNLGTATIYASLTYEGVTYEGSYDVMVRNSMWTLLLSAEDNNTITDEYVVCTDEMQLKAIAMYSTTTPQDVTEEATWTSSDESIFTVNKGLIKRVGDGNATITVTLGADKGSETKSIIVMSQGATGHIDPTTFTLTYDSNGGTACSPGSVTVDAIGSTWGELCTPTREGYTFNGWFTAKNGGTKITSATEATDNITVYAQWKKIPTNPNTGIETPVIGLIGILILSLSGYLIIKNKSKSLQ